MAVKSWKIFSFPFCHFLFNMFQTFVDRTAGAGSNDPLAACSIIKKQHKKRGSTLAKAAAEHQQFVKGATMYPLEHHPGYGLLCTVP